MALSIDILKNNLKKEIEEWKELQKNAHPKNDRAFSIILERLEDAFLRADTIE